MTPQFKGDRVDKALRPVCLREGCRRSTFLCSLEHSQHLRNLRKDTLPAPGVALLDELGFAWNSQRRIRVTEECFEAGRTLYVLGTLDERRNLPEPSEAGLIDRGLQLVVSGKWRRALIGAVPHPLRVIFAVLIGYLDMLTQLGLGGNRSPRDIVAAPPPMAPDALVVWKGRGSRPFLVLNRPEKTALAALRRRSLWTFDFGGGVLCFTLYQLVQLFVEN